MTALPKLFIPQKTSEQPAAMMANWLAIENWANSLPSEASSFYASLTGDGETMSPGDLTQEGGFTVNSTDGFTVNDDSSPTGITLSETGESDVNIESSNGVLVDCTGFNLTQDGTGRIELFSTSAAADPPGIDATSLTGISLSDDSTQGIQIEETGASNIVITTEDGFVEITASSIIALNADVSTPSFLNIAAQFNDNIGFFGTTPVGQQSASDLAGVIAALQAYGLLS